MGKLSPYPKGVRVTRRPPKMRHHRGATWDKWVLVLPDGSDTWAYLDTSWGVNFFFELAGVWRQGKIDDFKIERSGGAHLDLRDQKKLAECEALIERYENALRARSPDYVSLGEQVEDAADACGYNDHRRLAALHTWAEQLAEAS